MMLRGETVHSPAPWDLPLWSPDYVIFFGVLYLVLAAIGLGLGLVICKTIKDSKDSESQSSH